MCCRYPAHAFIILTLQKLVHMSEPTETETCEGEATFGEYDGSHGIHSGRKHRSPSLRQRIRRGLGMHVDDTTNFGNERGTPKGDSGRAQALRSAQLRTLQRYHCRPNDPGADFMEDNSALACKDLAVAVEQVSIFIMSDNTIISFFETSAEDIEKPIIRRLQTPDTILRQSCDASMVGQSIIDAIIDLAIPVASCYSDVVADLELDVLTQPDITHTKRLYIIVTEINKMMAFISPITNLINALRDHKTDMTQAAATQELQNPLKGVIITPMTYTYLGDVLDHCILISESLNQVKQSADGMIDLIFNTISAMQNETMKQLTVATIIFLPLTFLTGYYGMNFQPFDDLDRGISYL